MKRWIRCVLDFVMLVVFSMICAQTVMAAETGTTTDAFRQDAIKPKPEINIPKPEINIPETEINIKEETVSEVSYRVVPDDTIEGAQVECPDQAVAGVAVPVLVRADGNHRIRSVVAHYYDASFEERQIEMDPLMEDEDGVHYEFIMPDADVVVLVMTEVLHDVRVQKSDGGTVTASHDRACFNDFVTLTAEPEEGYQFVSWEVYEESGSQIGVRSDDTFLMGLEAVTVRAIFEKREVTMPSKAVIVTTSDRKKNTKVSNQGGNRQGETKQEKAAKQSSPVIPAEKAQLLMNAKLLIDTTGKGVAVRCGNVSGANRYEVYAEYCGKHSFEKIGELPAGAGKVSFLTLHGKKLNRKKNIQAYVLAYRGGQLIAKSMTVYVAGSENKKSSNVRKIRTDKNTYKVKTGKTKKIEVSAVYKNGKKKQLSGQCKAFRYASSDPSIATVNKNGIIKGKKRGTCWVRVYAKNGCSKKVKVIVR